MKAEQSFYCSEVLTSPMDIARIIGYSYDINHPLNPVELYNRAKAWLLGAELDNPDAKRVGLFVASRTIRNGKLYLIPKPPKDSENRPVIPDNIWPLMLFTSSHTL